MKRLRAIIADDHALFREALGDFIRGLDAVEVCAEAGNGREAVELAERLEPDLVIMDIEMPELNGVEACREIKMRRPSIRIVLYTMHEPRMYCAQAGATADACLSKDDIFDLLPGIIDSLRQRLMPNNCLEKGAVLSVDIFEGGTS